jgi:HK97 family phage major capsid protein
MLHAMHKGDMSGLDDIEEKMISGASSPDGAVNIPEVVSAQITDMARNRAAVMSAGAMTMPMGSRWVVVPKLTQGSTPGWRGENDPITEGGPQFGYVRLNANVNAVLLKFSWELLEDSTPDVWGFLAGDAAAQIALAIDYAALAGTGTGNQPLGIMNTEGVHTQAAVGTPTNYDDILDAMADIEGSNHDPRAWMLNSATMRTYRGLKTGISSDNTPLQPPADVSALRRFVTNQLPATEGVGSDESSMVVGDFRQLIVGFRPQLGVRLIKLNEAFAANGQAGLIIWWRGDTVVRHPEAFCVLSGVTQAGS